MLWIGPEVVSPGICCNSQTALKPNPLSCRLFSFLCVVITVVVVHDLVGVAQTAHPNGHGVLPTVGTAWRNVRVLGGPVENGCNCGEAPSHLWMN